MKRLIPLFLSVIFIFAITACEQKDPENTTEPKEQTEPVNNQTPEFAWTEENFPRIDGSTATIPLGQAIAATLLNKNRADCEKYTEFSGTTRAYVKLANKETDLLIVYEGSASTMEELGDIFEIAPIGRDALVFLVNANNPVNNISTNQLQDIYKGVITNWKDIGGNDFPIIAYQRNETSGSQTMMKKLVMDGLEFTTPATELVISEMGGLVDAIASYNNGETAIGYNVFYYVTQMKLDENIKLLSIDNIVPTSETIGEGKYPFINDFFVVIRKDAPEESAERRLFEWIKGAEAKTLMDSEGYVSIK